MEIKEQFLCNNEITIYKGDCLELLRKIPDNYCDLIITSPPYCIGKAYENIHDDINTFIKQQKIIFEDIYRILKVGGSLCWQVGYHIAKSEAIPLDYYVYQMWFYCLK